MSRSQGVWRMGHGGRKTNPILGQFVELRCIGRVGRQVFDI